MGFATQKDLAKALGMKEPSRVGKWEAGMALPRGKLRDKLLTILRIDEAALFGLTATDPQPAATVGDMTPADLEALVARASKRDGEINLEIARLKKEIVDLKASIHPAIWEKWNDPQTSSEMKVLCLFFLTGRKEFAAQLPIKKRADLHMLFRILGISPPNSPT